MTDEDLVYLLGNSHIDAAWLWRAEETVEVCRNTFRQALDLMHRYPGFTFAQSSAQFYLWMEEKYPGLFEEIKRRVKEGVWELVGGAWVEVDPNIPSGESHVRQLLYGKRYFMDRFGVDVKVAWLPDSFGFPWTLPQIYAKAGIKYFLTQKLNWNDAAAFPYYVFWWEAPDGSRVLAHQTVGSYSENVDKERVMRQLRLLKRRQGIGDLLVLYGWGDHGGGPQPDMLERAMDLVEGRWPVKGRFSTALDYFRRLEELAAAGIPVVRDELYLQFHRGTYTTQARVKKYNRLGEALLETAEKLAVMAYLRGASYPKERLDQAWRILLFNQFHDILAGSSIPEVYEDAEKDFDEMFKMLYEVIDDATGYIASKIDTQGPGRALIVFNQLAWSRDGLVELEAVKTGFGKEVKVLDEKGVEQPAQLIDDGRSLLFIARDVPPLGYRVYRIVEGTPSRLETDLKAEEAEDSYVLENRHLRVVVSRKTGLVTSIYDKASGREFVDAKGCNVLQVFEDVPVPARRMGSDVGLDAWEIYIYQQVGGVRYVELTEPEKVELVEDGPVRAAVKIVYRYRQEGRPDSVFTVYVSLYSGMPFVDFRLFVDWHAAHRLVKTAFHLKVRGDFATYEIPYGWIRRRSYLSPEATLWEKAKWEVPGQKWVDYTDENGEYGVSLLNDCKYGFDMYNGVLRMTLLRSPRHPKHYGVSDETPPFTDQGMHEIRYALYPHPGDWRQARTPHLGYEYNYPLVIVLEPPHEGVMPSKYSMLSCRPGNVILTVVKKAEDGDGIVLRMYEAFGEASKAEITLGFEAGGAVETDLLERPMGSVEAMGNKLQVPIGICEIKTVKVNVTRLTGL